MLRPQSLGYPGAWYIKTLRRSGHLESKPHSLGSNSRKGLSRSQGDSETVLK